MYHRWFCISNIIWKLYANLPVHSCLCSNIWRLQSRNSKCLQGQFNMVLTAISAFLYTKKQDVSSEKRNQLSRRLTFQMTGSFTSARRGQLPLPPSRRWFVVLSQPLSAATSVVTINLTYLMYDKSHGPHYRIQDIQRVLWKHSSRQLQHTQLCFNKRRGLPSYVGGAYRRTGVSFLDRAWSAMEEDKSRGCSWGQSWSQWDQGESKAQCLSSAGETGVLLFCGQSNLFWCG